MESRSVTIKNLNGLHLRVASDIVLICRKYISEVRLSCSPDAEADGRSILAIVELGATAGTVLIVSAEGPDAREAADEVCRYFSACTEDTSAVVAAAKQPAVCHSV